LEKIGRKKAKQPTRTAPLVVNIRTDQTRINTHFAPSDRQREGAR